MPSVEAKETTILQIPLAQIRPDPSNPRSHPEEALGPLEENRGLRAGEQTVLERVSRRPRHDKELRHAGNPDRRLTEPAGEVLAFDACLFEHVLESPRCIEEGQVAPETVLNQLIEEDLVGGRGRVNDCGNGLPSGLGGGE